MNNDPLISVITVVLNSVKNIEPTISSVVDQLNENMEYLVIDGGSTDGTILKINKFQKKISYFISEPDIGIYSAINKAIIKARGKFIYIINCGDIMLKIPESIINENLHADLLCFPVILSSGSVFYPKLNSMLRFRNTLPHQGCLYRNIKGLSFNEKYKVFSDFDLNQKYLKNKKKIIIFQFPIIASHEIDGLSHNSKHSLEIFKIVRNNYGTLSQLLSFFNFKYLGLLKRLRKFE